MSSKNVHSVKVSVNPDKSIVCDPDTITIKGKNALITFKLVTVGYAFPEEDAIDVDGPSDEFPYSSWTTKPTMAVVLDLNKAVGEYNYSVRVVEVESGADLEVDPLIKNEGE